MSDETLLPCPFCGGPARAEAIKRWNTRAPAPATDAALSAAVLRLRALAADPGCGPGSWTEAADDIEGGNWRAGLRLAHIDEQAARLAATDALIRELCLREESYHRNQWGVVAGDLDRARARIERLEGALGATAKALESMIMSCHPEDCEAEAKVLESARELLARCKR